MRRTWFIQAGGYLVLLVLIFEWLGISDRSVGQVLLSALVGLVILAGGIWLIAAALAGSERVGLQRIVRVAIWVGAMAAVAGFGMFLGIFRARVGLSIASHLTLWSRHPVKPQPMGTVYIVLVTIATVAGLLALLPLASRAATGAGTAAGRLWRDWRYWAISGALVAVGYWLPGLVVGWVPKFSGFAMQTVSMLIRFALAYGIAVAAWLAIAWQARGSRFATTA